MFSPKNLAVHLITISGGFARSKTAFFFFLTLFAARPYDAFNGYLKICFRQERRKI
jgi:hypothetical protein